MKMTKKRYTYEIKPDEHSDFSPREWDNLGKIVAWHKRYNLGDDNRNDSVNGWITELLTELYPEKRYDENWYEWLGTVYGGYNLNKAWDMIHKRAVILPVYAYEHGGITISVKSFSCRWDSGQVGFIYATRETILKEYNAKYLSKKVRNKAKKLLISEIETLDQYLIGDVWGYVITDTLTNETIDSCWGFYGQKYCELEAESSIEWFESQAKKEMEVLESRMLGVPA